MKTKLPPLIAMVSFAMLILTNGIAQQSNMVINFEGKNAQTGTTVLLESVYVKNLTKDCDTTLYGTAPYLYLSWPSSIDGLFVGSQAGFNISPNYPNPFSSSTTFELSMTERSKISINLFDVYGALHATIQQELDLGRHTFEVLTTNSSIYFITADNGKSSQTIKLVSIGNTSYQNQAIRYQGFESLLKAGTLNNTFSFQPGDQLMMTGSAEGYFDKTILQTPTENTTYIFELDPAMSPLPVAEFTGNPVSGTAPLTVNFTDQSTNNPVSWQWNFGDGSTSTQQNPQHTYQNAGTYTVALTVTNSHGSDTETKTNYIEITQAGSAPVAEFTGNPVSGTAPLTVNFTDQSSNSPTSWNWNFGDGNSSNQQNPGHTYQNAGSYTVALTATNSHGQDTETKTNYITVTSGGGGFNDVYNPATGKTWMDRNLGASRVATSSTDAEAYGDLYQWGRLTDGHQNRTSGTTSTLSSSDVPGHGNFITVNSYPYDWRSPQNSNLWQGVSGTNNPCPTGYRLPTEAEWNAERQSWNSNNAAGAFNSPLKLPVAGSRYNGVGSLYDVGFGGRYWSATVDGTHARRLYFYGSVAGMVSSRRASGDSVRCIKD